MFSAGAAHGARDAFSEMYLNVARAQHVARQDIAYTAGYHSAVASAGYVAPSGYAEDGTPLYGLTDQYDSVLYGLGDLT